MIEEYLFIKFGFCFLAAILLIAIIVLVIEAIRTLMGVRRIVDRVELATDIKGWVSFFRKCSKSKG